MALVGGPTQLKLTQKLPDADADADGRGRQGELTTLYLSEAEHAALAQVPAAALTKSRLSIAAYGVDVFHGALAGLFLAEAEFASVAAAAALVPAAFCRAEVTADRRFTGGELVRATGEQVRVWARDTASRWARR